MRKHLLVLAAAACMPCWAASPQLTEIDASQASVPIDPYFSYVVAGDEQEGVLQGLRFPMMSRLRPAELEQAQVPVFEARWLTQPLAVVGADPVSLAWLERHLEQLHRQGAALVVVAAPNAEAFKRLQTLADGLPVAPSLGPWLTEQLWAAGVQVVPVFIGLDGQAMADLEAVR